MPIEKRKEPRRHLIFYLKVVDPVSGQLIGHLVDISPVGMMMICQDELATNQEIPVKLILPAVFESATHLELIGDTVWCHKDVNPDYYAVGIRFRNTTPENTLIIQDLVDSFGFQA